MPTGRSDVILNVHIGALVAGLVWATSTPLAQPVDAALSAGAVFRDCADCPAMVVIPAGSNIMGSTYEETDREGVPVIGNMDIAAWERPRHTVTIAQPFAIGSREVTRAQFSAFAEATGHDATGGCRGDNDGTVELVENWSWQNPGFAQGPDHPVLCVSYADAITYTKWLSDQTGASYRLPSETEWEYAARAGTETARYWGDGREQACLYENVADQALKQARPNRVSLGTPPFEFACDDGYAFSSPVGRFQPNAFGVYDMIGNAREWVADCFDVDFANKPRDGRPLLDEATCIAASESILGISEVLYVVKASSFRYAPYGSRVARKGAIQINHRSSNVGFRVARDLP